MHAHTRCPFRTARVIAAITLAAGASTSVHADTFTWTGLAANNMWNDANNWFNETLNAVSNFPTTMDIANFEFDAAVINGGALDINILDPADTLTLGGGVLSATTIAGTLTNEGIVTFGVDTGGDNAGGPDQRLLIPSATTVTITGSGALVLDGDEGLLGVSSSGANVTGVINDADHTIQGTGFIRAVALTNLGSITAAGGTLTVFSTLASGTGVWGIASDGTLLLQTNTEVDGGTFDLSDGAVMNLVTGSGILNATINAGDSSVNPTGGTFPFRNVALNVTGTLTIGGGVTTELTMDGTVTNGGILTFGADASGNNTSIADQRILIPSSSTLTLDGTGLVQLNGDHGFDGIAPSGATVSTLIQSADHTIHGSGLITDLAMTHLGSINATGGLFVVRNTLITGGGGWDLAGTSTLDLKTNTAIDGGTFDLAAGAQLILDTTSQISNATLNANGSFINPGGGTITLNDMNTSGTLTIGGGTVTVTRFTGTLNNTGTITYGADSSGDNSGGPDQEIRIEAGDTLTLEGDGQILMNGDAGFDGISPDGANVSTLIHTASHTLSGTGIINDIALTNLGTIDIFGGPLTLIDTLAGGAGVWDFAGDATLELRSGSVIDGGTLNFVDGAQLILVSSFISNATMNTGDLTVNPAGGLTTLQDVALTNTGTIMIGGGSSSTATITGTITNNGVITFGQDSSGNNLGGPDQRISVPAGITVTLGGTGEALLNGDAGFDGLNDATSVLVNTAAHSISGTGIINDLIVDNDGMLSPGTDADPYGQLTFTDSSIDFSDGVVEIDLAGTGESDTISIEGVPALDGMVTFRFPAGSVPTVGQRFTILTHDAAPTSFFDNGNFHDPLLGSGNAIRIVSSNTITEAVITCATDLTGDGVIDISDLLKLLAVFNTPSPEGDITNDNVSDISDLLALLAVFGSECQ